MTFCPNCGNKLEETSKFCRVCGTPVAAAPVVEEPVVVSAPAEEAAPAAPTYTEPIYTAPAAPVYEAPATPVYQAPPAPVYTPTTYVAPPVPTSAKVLGFVGMGMGIGGLVFAVLGILYTLLGFMEEGMAFGMAFAFSMFSLPLSIVGRVLITKSTEAGFQGTPCSVGNKLGLAGIIVSAVMLFLGVISLMTIL